jgi:TolB protein
VTAEVFVVDELIVAAQRGGTWDLHMMRGTGLTLQITRDSALEIQAAHSPDLTRLVYAASPSPRSSNFQLVVADADGGGARPLTADTVPAGSPSFAGSGRIVYHAGRPGRQQLYVVNVDGTERRPVMADVHDNSMPSVSPDSSKVVFASVRETSPGPRARADIFEIGLDGTGERQLTTNPRVDDSPQYSGDGRSVYFLRDEGGRPATKRVIKMDLATRVETPLTPVGTFVQSYSVSADGGRIALAILEANNVVRMAIFDVATQALTPVPVAAGEVLASPSYRPAAPPAP